MKISFLRNLIVFFLVVTRVGTSVAFSIDQSSGDGSRIESKESLSFEDITTDALGKMLFESFIAPVQFGAFMMNVSKKMDSSRSGNQKSKKDNLQTAIIFTVPSQSIKKNSINKPVYRSLASSISCCEIITSICIERLRNFMLDKFNTSSNHLIPRARDNPVVSFTINHIFSSQTPHSVFKQNGDFHFYTARAQI
jgi:hypothetical protein